MSTTAGHETAPNVLAAVYDDLREAARRFLSEQRRDHTLQPTALVHEVYLRLAGQPYLGDLNRAQVLSIAVKAMRYVLVDHARRRKAQKRGGNAERVPLDEALAMYEGGGVDLIVLSDALDRLAEDEPAQARVIELRFFGGLSEEETADALECSSRTVRRAWREARRRLARELGVGT